MMTIKQLEPADWATLRSLRLAALAESPGAFWSTWADEAKYGQNEWLRFLHAARWWTARRDERPCGILAALFRDEARDEAELVAMWVEPAERRCGTATQLLQTAVREVRNGQTISALTLWVADGNEPAACLYAGFGFQFTGERAPAPHPRATGERRMRLTLSAQHNNRP